MDGARFFSISDGQYIPVHLLVFSILSYDICPGKTGQVIRALTQLIGKQIGLVASFLVINQILLIQICQAGNDADKDLKSHHECKSDKK